MRLSGLRLSMLAYDILLLSLVEPHHCIFPQGLQGNGFMDRQNQIVEHFRDAKYSVRT